MQQFEIEVGGRVRRVGVAKAGDGFAVTIDDRTIHVNFAPSGVHTMSLICHTPEPNSYEVTIAPDAASPSQLTVRVGAVPVPLTVNGRRGRARKDERGGSTTGPQRVTAPMPGKVVRVLVKPGDAVHARQPLVVVEAMKMENELRASRDGTIAELRAEAGQSVDAGTVLVVVK
jgi:biotin carboxyl carrier protein